MKLFDKMNRQGAKDAKRNSTTTIIHELPGGGGYRNGLYLFFTTPGPNFCKCLIEHP